MTPYSIRNRRGEIGPIGSAYVRSLSPAEADPIVQAARKPSKWPAIAAALVVAALAVFLLLDGHSEADDARATAAALLDAQAQAQSQLGAQK